VWAATPNLTELARRAPSPAACDEQIGRKMNRVIDKVDCAADLMVAKRAAGLSAVRTRHNQDSVSCRGLLNRTVFHRIGNVRLGRLHQPAGVGLLLIAVLLLGIDSTAVAQTFCDYLSGRSPTYQLRA
jgi:hypothetical protein